MKKRWITTWTEIQRNKQFLSSKIIKYQINSQNKGSRIRFELLNQNDKLLLLKEMYMEVNGKIYPIQIQEKLKPQECNKSLEIKLDVDRSMQINLYIIVCNYDEKANFNEESNLNLFLGIDIYTSDEGIILIVGESEKWLNYFKEKINNKYKTKYSVINFNPLDAVLNYDNSNKLRFYLEILESILSALSGIEIVVFRIDAKFLLELGEQKNNEEIIKEIKVIFMNLNNFCFKLNSELYMCTITPFFQNVNLNQKLNLKEKIRNQINNWLKKENKNIIDLESVVTRGNTLSKWIDFYLQSDKRELNEAGNELIAEVVYNRIVKID